jgi:hypothetical protein
MIVSAFMIGIGSIRVLERSGDLEAEMLGRGLVVGTVGMLAAFIFLSAQYDKSLPFMLGALCALSNVARPWRRA